MLGVYLGARAARLEGFSLVYNDIDSRFNCDLVCNMLEVDLNNYDYIIATPPCNFWSRANNKYLSSYYSLKTKNLLPSILIKAAQIRKPFIVENVINFKRFENYGIFKICNDFGIFYFKVGRHLFFTNRLFCYDKTKKYNDFKQGGYRLNKDTQGGKAVNDVIKEWIRSIEV